MINKLIIKLFHLKRRGDMIHLLVILYFSFVTDSLTTYFTFKDSNLDFAPHTVRGSILICDWSLVTAWRLQAVIAERGTRQGNMFIISVAGNRVINTSCPDRSGPAPPILPGYTAHAHGTGEGRCHNIHNTVM